MGVLLHFLTPIPVPLRRARRNGSIWVKRLVACVGLRARQSLPQVVAPGSGEGLEMGRGREVRGVVALREQEAMDIANADPGGVPRYRPDRPGDGHPPRPQHAQVPAGTT